MPPIGRPKGSKNRPSESIEPSLADLLEEENRETILSRLKRTRRPTCFYDDLIHRRNEVSSATTLPLINRAGPPKKRRRPALLPVINGSTAHINDLLPTSSNLATSRDNCTAEKANRGGRQS